jgi:SAM-dependent methyltransferase
MASSARWRVAQSAERKWWQNYLRGKDVPSYLRWKTQYWQGIHDIVRQSIDFTKVKSIADMGCGPAGIFTIYASQYAVTALDPLLLQYEKDLPHFKQAMYPNVHFLAESIEAYSGLAQNDVVYCLNAVNHVQDIERCYEVLCNATKSGGYLIMSIDAHNNNFLKKIFQLLPGDILHPHQLNKEEYAQLAIKNGLEFITEQKLKKEGIFSYYLQIFKKL